jgi:hypothetical protein
MSARAACALLLCLAGTAVPAEPGVAVPPTVLAALEQLARDSRPLPLAERIAAISAPLVGAPYLEDPIGEGVPPDADPQVRYDAFDCLTFVEEVLALSLPLDPSAAGSVRTSLRYGGQEPSYVHRQHFMELQWIPQAEAHGWLRPTTAEYGPVEHLTQQVDPATWSAWSGRARFQMPDEDLPIGQMALDVLPLDAAIAAVSRIRPGSVLMIVREPRAGVPLWITHLGFVLAGPQPVLRHASRMASTRRVYDHDLRWYLEHQRASTHWPVRGVAIYEPIEPAGPPTP